MNEMGMPLEALGPGSIVSALGCRRFAPTVMREDLWGWEGVGVKGQSREPGKEALTSVQWQWLGPRWWW